MTAPSLDDTLFDDLSIPASFETFRVDGSLDAIAFWFEPDIHANLRQGATPRGAK